MAGEEDGFLQRWSRRKQQAAHVAPSAPDPAEAAARKAEADAAEARRVAEEEAARAEVVAGLPKLEDLAADSDFRAFMHPLVPAALRSAALARMWTLDPSIRDFVGPARDYAWDWNAPGGVPGGGPAPSLSEVEATLRKLTARLDSAEPETDAPPAPAESATPEDAPPPATSVAVSAASPAPSEPAPSEPAPSAEASEPTPAEPARRRHGGAMPA